VNIKLIDIKKITSAELIYYLLILYALTLPLSRAAVSGLPVMVLLVWIYNSYKQNKFHEYKNLILNSKPLFIFIIFSIYALITLSWSDMSGGEYRNIYKLFAYTLIIPIVMFTSLNNKEKSTVLSAFFLGMFISELISYSIFFDFLETNTSRNSEFPTPFMSHIQYSTFLAIIAPLLLIKFFNVDTVKEKVFYSLYLLMVVINLFISGGRTGQLAFLCAVVIVFLMSFKNKFKAFLISIGILFSMLFIMYNSIDTFNNKVNTAKNDLVNVYENNMFCTSWGIRLGSYEIAFDLAKEKPFVGYGLFGQKKSLDKLIDLNYPERACIKNHGDFQNQFLLVLVQYGIIGLIIYLIFFIKLFNEKNNNPNLQNLKYIFLTVFCIFFMSEGLIYQFSNALFGFLLALSLKEK